MIHVYILTPATIIITITIISARAPILIAARTVDMVAVA
jgi:hypothetical protein